MLEFKKNKVSSKKIEKAIEMAFSAHAAFDAGNDLEGQELLIEALNVDPYCTEALLLEADLTCENPLDELDAYSIAYESAIQRLVPKMIEESTGSFWSIFETRPYMRAKFGLAQALWELRRQREAIAHLEEMLRLNPNDNQGVRYVLFNYLLMAYEHAGIPALLKSYPESSAFFAYNTALYYFRLHGSDNETARKFLHQAFQLNRKVFELLIEEIDPPENSPISYSPGSKDEAVIYVKGVALAWANTPLALDWMSFEADNFFTNE